MLWLHKVDRIIYRFVVPIGGLLVGALFAWYYVETLDSDHPWASSALIWPTLVIIGSSLFTLILANTKKNRAKWDDFPLEELDLEPEPDEELDRPRT